MQISCQLLAPGSARASETLFLRGCSCPPAFSRRVLWAPGEETAGEPQRSTEAGFTAAGGSWAWWHPPVSTVRPLLPIKSRPLPGRLWGCHSVCLLEPGKDTAPVPAPAPRREGPCRLLASVSDPGAGCRGLGEATRLPWAAADPAASACIAPAWLVSGLKFLYTSIRNRNGKVNHVELLTSNSGEV